MRGKKERERETIVHLRIAIKLTPNHGAEKVEMVKHSAIVICIYTGWLRGVSRSIRG